MPRLSPALIRRAARQGPLLSLLLRECRDLRSAQNELRWLKEHAVEAATAVRRRRLSNDPQPTTAPAFVEDVTEDVSDRGLHARRVSHILASNVRRRSRGEPLQYILGNQPFGDLEILCRRNVLIPRPETETYTEMLGRLLNNKMACAKTLLPTGKLSILDLCTGSGCIALLLHSLLRPPKAASECRSETAGHVGLNITGLDISSSAIDLARDNLQHNVNKGLLHKDASRDVSFAEADVSQLADTTALSAVIGDGLVSDSGCFDVVISNPPYISPEDYAPGGTTARSVRKFEPKLALVPQASGDMDDRAPVPQADVFYYWVLQIARKVRAQMVVMETGGGDQVWRVQHLMTELMRDEDPNIWCEIWLDDGSIRTSTNGSVGDQHCANCRALVLYRHEWARWRREHFAQR